MAILKPQSLQMLTLLDRMDDMNLNDIREITDLICGLAYSFDNSVIKDDIHMIIRKQLGSSSPSVKVKGILAGVHAIKYLMAVPLDDVSFDIPNEVSNISISFLSEGAPREAAQLIELISCSTKQFPDLTAFFYDELSNIISNASYINKRFLAWLTDAVTNDLQQNFIVNVIPDSIDGQELSMQYCLNSDSEVDEIIAINIGGLTLEYKDDVNIGILSPLIQLVSTAYFKQCNGNLSNIDALLGCPVVMPKYDIELIEDMEDDKISNILDCLIHCSNWFRELLNAFVIQTDDMDIPTILKRILNIEEIEKNISQILLKTKTVYKPPICVFNINKYTGEQKEKQLIKPQIGKKKTNKKVPNDDTVLPETGKIQTTQHNTIKDKVDILYNMPFRKLNLNLIKLINNDFTTEPNSETELNIDMLKFILKNTNGNIDTILLSKIKKKTFLSKQDDETYDPKKAEHCAQAVSEILPKLMCHLDSVIKYIENNLNGSHNDTGFMYTSEMTAYFMVLEYLYNMLTTYFKWIGFRNQNKALLKTSLRTIAVTKEDPSKLVSLNDLLLSVAKLFQSHEKYCLQLSVGVALMDLMSAIQELSNNIVVVKIVKTMASSFLSQEWKTLDGHLEKGLYFNQAIDKFIRINFMQSELTYLKSLSIQIVSEIQRWKNRNDALESMKCINKSNFAMFYRNLGTTLYETTKRNADRGLTDSEHLEMWQDVATILKHMSEMARTLENRNTLSALFKKSMPVLKLFLSQGMPIIEMRFKTETDEILEILKLLQQSTRFLQSLCCHSRLTKDTALMTKVPQMRQLLETLIYKVKAALAANNCSEAFWMGNLKNKNIRGEIIVTQLNTDSDEMPEDCDEELPDDEDQNNSDEEINTDSRSISDTV
ncbi:Fanconi anemia group D2 protein [Eumeta japonica]|uniref:Fanconi anemia group D2 protein n=1 Tax=Eumeta variegata TaxID=151549 RepID=A0A4C1TQK7_EUMVA|nr:Fanconi anemia group D2 protein [Eumeta japonica]